MTEKPTEDSYTTELASTIKAIGGKIDFDAETFPQTPSGKPDIKLLWRGKTVAVIEVKNPSISLADPKLKEQALRYAEWYRQNLGVEFYGIHNMKYLQLFKYAKHPTKKVTLLNFIEPKEGWVPVSDFPFKIIPWAKSILDYKEISTNSSARRNLENFLIKFRELLEGKSIDISKEVIETIASYIEKGSSEGLAQLEQLYKGNKSIRKIFLNWLGERGYQKPGNDDELRKFLRLMLKEQLYTFSMKILFYLVLQSIDVEMASRLREDVSKIELLDPVLFKKVFDALFEYAIERTNDFEEVFGSNAVDKLPFVPAVIPVVKELIDYLNQIRWSDVSIDVIGRIFEGLIYKERRHLLGQHFTETKIVDLILTATLKEPKKIIDPACGSGTFLVRALNYWRVKYPNEPGELLVGIDIDKLAVMLSKINLYIQMLEKIKEGKKYIPQIYHGDTFKLSVEPDFGYVVANPPYTRQEELAMAFYDKDYKKKLMDAVEDIEEWSKKASIYAYFLVKGGKLLQKGSRLGFVVENSWMNAEYGHPLKKWFLDNFSIELVIESLVEKWFEDAEVITNIIVAEKIGGLEELKSKNYIVNFMFLKKKILGSEELLDEVPSAADYTANQRYYERIEELLNKVSSCSVGKKRFGFYEDEDVRIVACRKDLLEDIEERLSKWGILKAPKCYLELIVDYIDGVQEGITLIESVLDINYGLKTNANEIFYLPSKHWRLRGDKEDCLILEEVGGKRVLKLSKNHLRPLIRLSSIEDSPYRVFKLKKTKREDYVIWVDDVESVDDDEMKDYLEWAENFIRREYETNGRFSTLINKLESNTWTKLPDTSGAHFLLKNAIHKTFAIYFNEVREAQIDKRLFIGYLKQKVDPRVAFASLNSVLAYLGVELVGRTNLGQGALDVNKVDYYKVPIVDPRQLEEELKKRRKLRELLNIVDRILLLKPKNIEEEVRNPLRIKMDELVLSVVGLDRKDMMDLYKGLLEIVNYRILRSRT